MSAGLSQAVNQDDIKIFDDSDWDFFESDSDLDLFGDYEDDFILDERSGKHNVTTYISVGVLATVVLGSSGYLLNSFVFSRFYTGSPVIYADSKLSRVDGNKVSSNIEVEVNKVIAGYFGVYTNNVELSSLDNYCLDGSSVYSLEEKYRKESKYSLDSNDCYSRAIRSFSSFISLERVNSIVEKDGVLYVYSQIKAPSSEDLTEYYIKGSADMSYFFKSNAITSINISKYMLKAISNGDLPLKSSEVMFEVVNKDGAYFIKSDSSLQSFCTEPYINSISNIVDILGGQLMS